MKFSPYVLLVGSLLASPLAWSAGPSGAAIGRTCAGCHGTDGVSVGAVPTLRGRPVAYLEGALISFKTDSRKGSIMNRIAKGYSDKELTAVAKYFSELK